MDWSELRAEHKRVMDELEELLAISLDDPDMSAAEMLELASQVATLRGQLERLSDEMLARIRAKAH